MTTVNTDGTSKVVPIIFRHLYTLHGCFQGQIKPLAYFLLLEKTRESYTHMFQLIWDDAAQRNNVFRSPRFHVDFEVAVMNAIDIVFPPWK